MEEEELRGAFSDSSQGSGPKRRMEVERIELLRTMSQMYAMLLIVLGIVFPLTYFLSGGNESSGVYLSVFQIYVCLVSILFLGYLQIAMIYHKKRRCRFRACGMGPSQPDAEDGEEGEGAGRAACMACGGCKGCKRCCGKLPYETDDRGHKCKCAFLRACLNLREPETPTAPAGNDANQGDANGLRDGADPDAPDGTQLGLTSAMGSQELPLEKKSATLESGWQVEVLDDLPYHHEADGVNLFLRIGAVGFGLGGVVLDGFRMVQFAQLDNAWECYGLLFIIHTGLRLLYSFCLVFFVFRNHKLVVNFNKPVVRAGILHMIATNLCIWAITITMESSEAFNLLDPNEESDFMKDTKSSRTSKNSKSSQQQESRQSHAQMCGQEKTLADKAAPFLYPLVVQFTIISCAILYRIFRNIGREMPYETPQGKTPPKKTTIECHRATSGLFIGLFLLAGVAIAAAIFMMYDTGKNPMTDLVTVLVYYISDIAVNLFAIIASFWAIVRTTQLHYISDIDNSFNANLALWTLNGHFLMIAFTTVPSVTNWGKTGIPGMMAKFQCALSVLSFVQAIVQVVFIIDGLRRRAVDRRHRKFKPGRALLTFLLICNICMWLINTFELREAHTSPVFFEFYGRLPWTIIMHLTLPLAILFRFHSCICLCDIWLHAYKKPTKEVPIVVTPGPD